MRSDYFPTNPRRSGQSHRYLIQDPSTKVWLPVTLHADAKTSPAVMYESGGRATARVGNAWALPAGPIATGGSCNSTTPACTSCYAASLEGAYNALARMVLENLESLRTVARGGLDSLTQWLTALVEVSVDQQTAQGIQRPTFRWHSDGDLGALIGTTTNHRHYPKAIRDAARNTPHVDHWIYTRELWALPYLVGADNLRVLVSADQYNWHKAAAAAAQHDLPVALLANDPQHATHLWDQIRAAHPELAPPIACPATARWKHDGKGPAHIAGINGRRSTLTKGQPATGACTACQACLPNSTPRSITFHLHNAGNRLPAALATRARITSTPVQIGARTR
jgi:hypothetical protein